MYSGEANRTQSASRIFRRKSSTTGGKPAGGVSRSVLSIGKGSTSRYSISTPSIESSQISIADQHKSQQKVKSLSQFQRSSIERKTEIESTHNYLTREMNEVEVPARMRPRLKEALRREPQRAATLTTGFVAISSKRRCSVKMVSKALCSGDFVWTNE